MRRVKHYCTIRVDIVDGLSKMRSDSEWDEARSVEAGLGFMDWAGIGS